MKPQGAEIIFDTSWFFSEILPLDSQDFHT